MLAQLLETFPAARRCKRMSFDMSACGGKMGQGCKAQSEKLCCRRYEQNSRLEQLVEAIS